MDTQDLPQEVTLHDIEQAILDRLARTENPFAGDVLPSEQAERQARRLHRKLATDDWHDNHDEYDGHEYGVPTPMTQQQQAEELKLEDFTEIEVDIVIIMIGRHLEKVFSTTHIPISPNLEVIDWDLNIDHIRASVKRGFMKDMLADLDMLTETVWYGPTEEHWAQIISA